MKISVFIHTAFLLTGIPVFGLAQSDQADSLRNILSRASHDSVRNSICWQLQEYYEESNRDSARFYIGVGLDLSRKNGKRLSEARWLVSLAYQQLAGGLYAESLGNLLQAFSLAEKEKSGQNNWLAGWSGSAGNARPLVLSFAHHTFANLMTPARNTQQQVIHYREALRLAKQVGDKQRILLSNLGLGRTYLDNNRIDSALAFELEAARVAEESGNKRFLPAIQSYLGAIYFEMNKPELALSHLHYGIKTANEYGNPTGRLAQNYYRLTKYYLSIQNKDSALYYGLKFNQAMEKVGAVSLSTVDVGTSREYLSRAYRMYGQYDSAYRYQGLALSTKDSISNARINSLAEFQNLNLQEQLRLRNLEKEQALYQSRIRSYGLLAGLVVFSVIALILYRNNRQKEKANRKLEKALSDLHAAQNQLIQSEKMASLGELTAGIAHEIQNPLNFVNNFSELNKELAEELKAELAMGNWQQAKEIADDIMANEEKIHHHGKRADGIVKGMLQHSRTSSGQKELTDINDLCDEYLRLAYHGLRAKDKSFNARFETRFDEAVGKILLVPQDIGRVILNLINNAFYAVSAKALESAGLPYEPTVTVTTSRTDNQVEIRVADNGTGIPPSVIDKVFQPFFTTKPTGQGTGLGLSLSYDIVTKGHGGELRVETEAGSGTTFIVLLPAGS